MTRRFWLGVIAGCYVTHGETFIDPDKLPDVTDTPTIWWAHGGKLSGQAHSASPSCARFSKQLYPQAAAQVITSRSRAHRNSKSLLPQRHHRGLQWEITSDGPLLLRLSPTDLV